MHDIFTTVKIYIVTEDNRLEMKFKNPLKIVEDSRDQVLNHKDIMQLKIKLNFGKYLDTKYSN